MIIDRVLIIFLLLAAASRSEAKEPNSCTILDSCLGLGDFSSALTTVRIHPDGVSRLLDLVAYTIEITSTGTV